VLGKVAVCGATGRTGKLVVGELLDRGIDVVAVVRNSEKAECELSFQDPKVIVVKCDLSSEQDIAASIQGCDSVFWCATGFSDAETGFIQKLKSLFGIALAPKKSIGKFQIPIDTSLTSSSFSHQAIQRFYWDPNKCQLHVTGFEDN
jgi:putative NADH-flavin reductase